MSNTPADLSLKARQEFLQRNADILACLKQSKEEIFETIMANASLDRETREDFIAFSSSELLEQPDHYARGEQRKTFQSIVYLHICKAFLRCMNSRTLTCAIKFTQEAADQYTEIRYIAGELERPVAAKPVIVKTPQEILEDEVISDYATLSGDKMRAKMNANRAYRDTYNRLAETNRLESRVTQLHDGARL